ncbi:HsdM family class I SAM-dependent methyltransferase [Sporosarcina sp. SAFN-010]|uniref:HsdM family class I SAM-dependent methyltransferase n=1 Tax=Sporosarcina sp. SAFN-010 TaxID=3387273 RepID=UPI003F807EFD
MNIKNDHLKLENDIEKKLRRKGLPVVKREAKVGRSYVDLVGYSISLEGELLPEVVVEVKMNPTASAQQQLMKYVADLNAPYAVLKTNEREYWFEGKSFLPIDEPQFAQGNNYLVNEEDVTAVLYGVMDRLRGLLKPDQALIMLSLTLLVRSYLEKNQKTDLWWSIDNEDILHRLIQDAVTDYSLDIIPARYGLNKETISFVINQISALPTKSPYLQKALLKVEDQKTMGQYLSPSHVRVLFAKIAQTLSLNCDTVADLAAGMGSIAFEVMQTNSIQHLSGFEKQKDTCNQLKILSILGGFGPSEITCGDALSSENTNVLPDNSQSLVLVDPPLGGRYKLSEEQQIHFQLAQGKKSNEVTDLFIEKAIRVAKPGGYILALVPEKVLFSSSSKITREFIKENTIIEAIISLPPHTLKPYTAVKTSMLVLRRKLNSEETANELFLAQAESIDEFKDIALKFAEWKKGVPSID